MMTLGGGRRTRKKGQDHYSVDCGSRKIGCGEIKTFTRTVLPTRGKGEQDERVGRGGTGGRGRCMMLKRKNTKKYKPEKNHQKNKSGL